MQSANSVNEREILKKFGTGVRSWMEEKLSAAQIDKSITRIDLPSKKNPPKYILEFDYSEEYTKCDVAVIFGSWKPRDKGHHITRNSVANNADCFICIETPLLNRRTDAVNTAWRVGINGFLNQSAYWPTAKNIERIGAVKIEWDGWRNDPEGHIVLALQLPGDASLRGADINDWAIHAIRELRSVTDRAIRIRSHPMLSDRGWTSHADLIVETTKHANIQFSQGRETPWRDDIANAYCTVTYTSGMAIDSVLDGIPTIACDPGNFAWGISSNSLSDVENIKLANGIEIGRWIKALSNCQWTEDEMYSGDCWRAVVETLEKI